MSGRTETNKIVHFQESNIRTGEIVKVKIEEAFPHSLWGRIIDN